MVRYNIGCYVVKRRVFEESLITRERLVVLLEENGHAPKLAEAIAYVIDEVGGMGWMKICPRATHLDAEGRVCASGERGAGAAPASFTVLRVILPDEETGPAQAAASRSSRPARKSSGRRRPVAC